MLAPGAELADWLAWLETLSPNEIELGLERTAEVLLRLDLPRPPNVLLIAGTNGKGSSVAMADALLRAAGYTAGAYTSPHILCYNERIVVNGVAASDAEIVAAFRRVEAARQDTVLTYFEFGTLAAATVFAAAELDVWILEIGLGGRLDACNAIEPTASLITNVSLDHCEWLGDDVEKIGREKAGVMRRGIPTVFGSTAVPQSVRDHATSSGAALACLGNEFAVGEGDDGSWTWQGAGKSLVNLQQPGLLGDFQKDNAAAVLMLLEAAGLAGSMDAALVNRVLPRLTLSGRLQRVADGDSARPEWFVDVAHNPAAATALAKTLASMSCEGETVAIVGLLQDKDFAGVIGPLLPEVDQWIAVSADSLRAIPANELARRIANLANKACAVAESPQAAVELARRAAAENDRILVTGSFFTVGPIMSTLIAAAQS